MTQQTKNLEEYLIQKISKEHELSDLQQNAIRRTIIIAFRQGYSECLTDVREGLIK